MKRTIISLLLVVMLCMSLAISASAAYVDFIIDSQDVLTDDERTSLNDRLPRSLRIPALVFILSMSMVAPV